jgi:hypothetical protein
MVFDLPKVGFELTDRAKLLHLFRTQPQPCAMTEGGAKEIVSKPSFHQDCHGEGGPPTVATQLKFQMDGHAEPRHDNPLGF